MGFSMPGLGEGTDAVVACHQPSEVGMQHGVLIVLEFGQQAWSSQR